MIEPGRACITQKAELFFHPPAARAIRQMHFQPDKFPQTEFAFELL